MNGWLIYNQKDAATNQDYIKWFIEEARLQAISLHLIFREELTIGIINNKRCILFNNKPVKLPDFAVVRTIEPLLNLFLEQCKIKVFNSSKISFLANHKATTHFEMNKLDIPMVDTFIIKKEHLTINPPMTYPFVVKESTGKGGEQVYFVETDSDYKKIKDKITSSDLVIQNTHVQRGKDIRVYVIGRNIVGAVMRESINDFRANFKLGGSATFYILNEEERQLVDKIINAFDFGLVGIDFLMSHDNKFLFNEIEDVVGSRMLSAVSEINLLEKYVTHIRQNC